MRRTRRALGFLLVVAPVLSCGALAACTADDDDESFLPLDDAPDANDDATFPTDAPVSPPNGDATVQMNGDGSANGDDDTTFDSGHDSGHDSGKETGDATVHEDGGLSDASHDSGDASERDAADASDAGHDSGADADAGPATYTLGGTVVGLGANDTLTLANGMATVVVPAEAIAVPSVTFTLPAVLAGTAYTVTVTADPATPIAQHCTVANGTGVVAAANVTNIVVTCVNAYYVNPSTGLDTAAGSSAAPWKTLTHAIAAVPVAGAAIYAQPGTYNTASGETFPILPKSNQAFIGDVAHAGNGATPTQIVGSGTSGAFTGDVVLFGVTNVSMSGLTIGAAAIAFLGAGGSYGVIVDDSSATFASNNIGSDGTTVLAIENGSLVTLSSNTLTGNPTISTLSIADPTTTVTARGNDFSGTKDIVVASTATLANLDFGTAASPGNNSIVESGFPFVTAIGLTLDPVTGTFRAAGNIWTASLQGSDANGHYAAALVPGPVTPTGSANYTLPAGAFLQL